MKNTIFWDSTPHGAASQKTAFFNFAFHKSEHITRDLRVHTVSRCLSVRVPAQTMPDRCITVLSIRMESCRWILNCGVSASCNIVAIRCNTCKRENAVKYNLK
jgi:hypothetical protein